jgi:hypothetical protein
MDELIPYNEIMDRLKNPPSLDSRPTFFRLRIFRQHIIDAVKQLPHPAYPQHGWTGMILQPAMFALVSLVPFVPQMNPGLIAIYPLAYVPTARVKAIDAQFKLDKNIYKTYINIQRDVYKILTDNLRLEYQSSNTPRLMGWNQSMSIQEIFAQLVSSFGKLDAQAVLSNDTLYDTL